MAGTGLPFERARFQFSPHATLSFYPRMTPEMLKRLLALRFDDDVVISGLQFYSTPHPQPSKKVLELKLGGASGMMNIKRALATLSLFSVAAGCMSAPRSIEAVDPSTAKWRADSIAADKCRSMLQSSNKASASSTGDVVVRVHVSAQGRDTVTGASLFIEKPHLVVRSSDDGIVRLTLPSDNIPSSHSLRVSVQLIGWKRATGTIKLVAGDTISVEVRFCANPLYLHNDITTEPTRR